MKEHRNIAARAGRWSAQHRKKAIWGWLAFTFLAFAIGNAAGLVTQDQAQSGVGESGRADKTIDNAFPKHVAEEVLIQSGAATANDPAFRATVADVQRRLVAAPHTKSFESPYAPGNRGQISRDGHSALLRFEIAGTETQATRSRRPDACGHQGGAAPLIRASPSSSSATPARRRSSTRRSATTSRAPS